MSSLSLENTTPEQIFKTILTPVCTTFLNRFNPGIHDYTQPLCDFVQYYFQDSIDMVRPLEQIMLTWGYKLKMDTKLYPHRFYYTRELYFASTLQPQHRIIQITITGSLSSDPEGRGTTLFMIATVDPDYVENNYVNCIFDTARGRKPAATRPFFYETVYLNPMDTNAFDQINTLIDGHRLQANATSQYHKWSDLQKTSSSGSTEEFHCSKQIATGVLQIKFRLSQTSIMSDPPPMKLTAEVRFDATSEANQTSARCGPSGMKYL